MTMRMLVERPVVGGEKFAAVIGPSPAFRRLTRLLLVASLGALALAVFGAPSGLPEAAELLAAGGLFALCLASAWLSGGAEELVCQDGALCHRRAGAICERGRLVPLRDVREVEDPGPAGPVAFGGVAVRTASGVLRIGRRLSGPEARWLADAVRRHVGAGLGAEPRAGTRLPPHPAGPPETLARVRSRR